jgi:hypothetical protein
MEVCPNIPVARIEMKLNRAGRFKLGQFLVGAAIVFALMAAPDAKADGEHEHMVTDWSHRYVVYSTPQSLMRRFELSRDRRYVDQWKRRESNRWRHDRDEWRWHRAPEDPHKIQGDWSEDMGAGATVGAGNYPAKFSFNTTSANCVTPAPPVGQQPDFVVYNTSLAGFSTQADIVAFANLYSGCTGGTPQTYWAYNTGLGGAVVTSPVLSFDGTQVAFIENTGGAATLVVLRWKASTGTLSTPVTPTNGGCTALTAPCMTTVTFSSANSDTTPTDAFSSPFYDYEHDVLYVGDTSGFLHKFTGVFGGTPTEVVCTASTVTAGCALPAGTNLWPAGSLTQGFGYLNSPVFVGGFNEVLVTGSDGVIYAVDSTGGVSANGLDPKLASPGFDDGPLVDVTTGKVYLFARASSEFIDSNATFGFHGVPNVASVFQIDIPATPNDIHFAPYVQAIVSDSLIIPASAFYLGAFDDPYYSTSGTSGNLYVCSTSGSVNALWGIPITGNVMGTPSVGPTLTTSNVGCSPITEFNNTNTNNDRIFLSVAGGAITGGTINCPAAAGCIMSFDVDSPLSASTPTSATTSATGGTSGIVIDNASGTAGASQIYFTPLADQTCPTSTGTGGCAIQASQSALN